MNDQHSTHGLISAIRNPVVVALNLQNQERWKRRNEAFKRLNGQSPLAEIACGNVIRSLEFVQSATSKTERYIRFRSMRDYHDEVLSLAPADSELVLKKFKECSPLFKAQKERSTKPRIKLGDLEERPLKQHVLDLISQRERQGETASELWPHFICYLGQLGCEPRERPRGKLRTVEYVFARSKRCDSEGEPVRTMAFTTFQNLVSMLRKKSQ